jgi:hypothetical protein
MRTKIMILALCLAVLAGLVTGSNIPPEGAVSKEYEVKAAFLYNFIRFVEWPDETHSVNEPIIVGILGEDRFGDAFELAKDKLVKARRVSLRRFESLRKDSRLEQENRLAADMQIGNLKNCDVVFISASEKKYMGDILKAMEGSAVLTVGETEGFLESGGMVNFVVEDGKICFEINAAAAEQAGLEMRSRFMRLAKRIVKEEKSGV